MTGQELLAELQNLTPEQLALQVVTEGCDCYGDIHRIEPTEQATRLLRSPATLGRPTCQAT